MQNWSSSAEIASEFGFEQYASDTEALRSEMKKLVASLHPDRNGGAFPSEAEKAKFLLAKSAMDFLDVHSQSAMSMIPVSQLPAIVSAVAQALALRAPSELNSLQASYLVDARHRISRNFLLPRIGSGVFAAITGFLVAFPSNFEKHPLFGPLLEGRMTQYVLLTLLAYSALAFALTWYKERLAESRAEYLMSESATGMLFELIFRETEKGENVIRISSRQILDAVMEMAGYHRYAPTSPLQLFTRSRLDQPTIEKAATILTQRLVDRKVLSKIDAPSIDTWYEISAVARAMTPTHSFQ